MNNDPKPIVVSLTPEFVEMLTHQMNAVLKRGEHVGRGYIDPQDTRIALVNSCNLMRMVPATVEPQQKAPFSSAAPQTHPRSRDIGLSAVENEIAKLTQLDFAAANAIIEAADSRRQNGETQADAPVQTQVPQADSPVKVAAE